MLNPVNNTSIELKDKILDHLYHKKHILITSATEYVINLILIIVLLVSQL